MQMQSTYWLEKVLKMISLYVNAFLCTLQHIVIHAAATQRCDGLGGLVVSMLASDSRVRGFKPNVKILSMPSFGGEVK
jgi:hypothetical protein